MKTTFQIVILTLMCLAGCVNSRTAMEHALMKQDYNTVRILITEGADVNIRLINNNTPLTVACLEQKIDLVKFLISKGADVKAKDKDGDAPLNSAANLNSIEIAKILLEHGADPNVNYSSRSPLLYACQHNNLPMVKLLVEYGADVNLADASKDTPLIYTSSFNIVKYLVSKKADVNAANQDGRTVLMSFLSNRISSEKKRIKIMTFLIKHGAQINAIAPPNYSWPVHTVLDIAIVYKYPKEFITFLRKNGAKTAAELKSENLKFLGKTIN